MLEIAAARIKQLLRSIKEAGIQRRRRKLARLAEIEAKQRKAIVEGLTKKFTAARADCEHDDKTSIKIEFSIEEIIFIEGDLKTWNRYYKEREIYRPVANTQTPLSRSSFA